MLTLLMNNYFSDSIILYKQRHQKWIKLIFSTMRYQINLQHLALQF